CGRGFYKSSSQDLQCSRCPAHSFSDREGSSRCDCEDGYYRAYSDPSYIACTRPPSAPQNLIYNINQTTVSLEWGPPADNGGRNDVTYRVICKRCSWEQGECVPCGSTVGYVPQQSGLTDTYITVVDLLAHANYTFEVEAVNGVSDLSRSQRLFAAVSITTGQAVAVIAHKPDVFFKLCSPLNSRSLILYLAHHLPLRDNDPKHPSRLCKGYLTKKESDGVLHQMTWPPQSPDLNPIEMVWGELDRRVKAKGPTSAKHLWELLQDCWKTIPGGYILKLIKRMPRVCKAVIKAKGGYFEEPRI
ncbi:unnamed protein product, partial [Ranitomeya imitator]